MKKVNIEILTLEEVIEQEVEKHCYAVACEFMTSNIAMNMEQNHGITVAYACICNDAILGYIANMRGAKVWMDECYNIYHDTEISALEKTMVDTVRGTLKVNNQFVQI